MTSKSLTVGMVNPNDTKVINEIVYQTGLRPKIELVTHLEWILEDMNQHQEKMMKIILEN